MDDVTCTECGLSAYPALNMNAACAIVPCCPACGREHRSVTKDDLTQTVAVKAGGQVIPIRAESMGVISKPFPVAPSLEAPDPVAMIEQRIAWLSDQLSKQAEYAAERRKLMKMLKAAGQ